MYYLIEVQGKQYKVKEGDTIIVDNLNKKPGEKVTISNVLAMISDKEVNFGTPYLSNKKVEAIVEDTFKGEKIVIFKYMSKSNWRRKHGFRPTLTKLKITSL